jgi:hypothetical protein
MAVGDGSRAYVTYCYDIKSIRSDRSDEVPKYQSLLSKKCLDSFLSANPYPSEDYTFPPLPLG